MTILVADFLNIVRKFAPGGTFSTSEALIDATEKLSRKILGMGQYSKIYLVIKSFSLGNSSYKDIINIIMWAFCKDAPELIAKTCLVLVNGINPKDKSADDRALFIIHNEFSKINSKAVILSDDTFSDLSDHYWRCVTLSFCCIKTIEKTPEKSQITFGHTGTYKQRTNKKTVYSILKTNGQQMTITM